MTFFSAATTAPTAVVPSPVCTIPSLSAPSIPPTCKEEWERLASSNTDTVVYGLAWKDNHLVAVTSTGHAVIWKVPFPNEIGDLDEVQMLEVLEKQRRPLVKVQVSTVTLYSIQFHSYNERTFLFISGDEGVLGYDWRQWMELLEADDQTSLPPPKAHMHLKPHQSLNTVEINDFSISDSSHIYGAAGDAHCYKWDGETQRFLAAYPSAKRGYLHTVQCMPNDNNNNTVLMGGEDGFLGIWDGHHDKLIDNVNIQAAMDRDAALVEKDDSIRNSTLDTNSSSSLWISNIESTSENWWTICGGMQQLSTTRRSSPRNSPIPPSTGAGGHVTSWHAPTRSLVAGCLTREIPQYSCSTTGSLVTVANEGVVSHWTPSRVQRTARVWCSPPSCFAAAISDNDSANPNVLAVGGVGNQVDIFENVVDSKSFSLTL